MSDGIEIHFDEKRGYLDLACEPDAFAQYREVARNQLSDFPDIPIDKVLEINIVDTEKYVARRMRPVRGFSELVAVVVAIALVGLVVIGAVTVLRWIAA